MKYSSLLTGLVLAGGVAFAAPAFAQDQATPQPTASTTPTDVKPVGDWTVRCFPVGGPSPCDMYEELQDKNSHQRVLGVSIAYDPAADRNVAQIAVPLGVSIADGATIKTDVFTTPKLPYRRCDRLGCYVELILPADVVGQLSKSGPNATVNVVADDGKSFALRFSLNGFAGAHDAMSGLAKQKATAKPGDAAAAAAAGKKK